MVTTYDFSPEGVPADDISVYFTVEEAAKRLDVTEDRVCWPNLVETVKSYKNRQQMERESYLFREW